MLKRNIFWFFLLVSPLIGYTQSKEITEPKERVYPPYPDVWGYDLSEYPAFKWGGGGIEVYPMNDGDVWFIASTNYKMEDPMQRGSFKEKHYDQKYVLIKFFKQELIELTHNEMVKLSERLRDKYFSCILPQTAHFKSGSIIQSDYDPAPELCTVPDFIRGHLFKIEADKSKKKYTILAASPQIKVWRDNARCEAQGAPFIYQKLYFLPDCLIDLGDDTFLVFTRGSNLILRFDENLNTQFKAISPTWIQGEYINRNFFIIDYSIIDKLRSRLIAEPIPVYQTIHDELLVYLNNKYDLKNKE